MDYAIFGATGAVGVELGKIFFTEKIKFRVVGRSIFELKKAFSQYEPYVDYCVADLSKSVDAVKAATAVKTIFYTVGVPYTQFHQHPILSEICVTTAAECGVEHYVHVSTLYSFGLMQGSSVNEDHPREPHTYKGQMRKNQEDVVMNAHGKNGMKVTVLRPGDFYGGHSPLSLVHGIFEGALANKAADVIGPADTLHEFVYVPDLAQTLFDLSKKEEAYGQAWNLGGAGFITVRDFAKRTYAQTGAHPRLHIAGKLLLRLIGIFKPVMKEFVEMHYLMSQPLFVDDSRLQALLPNLKKTSYEEGIRNTLAAMRARHAITLISSP